MALPADQNIKVKEIDTLKKYNDTQIEVARI